MTDDMDFVYRIIMEYRCGKPIYSSQIADAFQRQFRISEKQARKRVSNCLCRIIRQKRIPELRMYRRGIYYLTHDTAFGELPIDREQLIADKYLLPDIGYETGFAFLNQIGLTSQVSRTRVFVSNRAKRSGFRNPEFDITIIPPRETITAENKDYFQILDALDTLDQAPIDAVNPNQILTDHIRKRGMNKEFLTAIAKRCYPKSVSDKLSEILKI